MNQQTTLYLSDEMLQLLRERRIGRWDELQLSTNDFVEMLYPSGTSGKQHEIALRLLTELFRNGELSNRDARGLVDSPSDKVLLMGHILPKMRKLGLVETDSQATPKKYKILYSTDFLDISGNLGVQWATVPRKIKKEIENPLTPTK